MREEFLAPIVERILALVQRMPIVRTRAGNWVEPRNALILPRQLIFNAEPLFTETELRYGTSRRYEYIDPEYDIQTQIILGKLGCASLSLEMVLSIISIRFPFSAKSYEWLASLFQYLSESPIGVKKAKQPSYLQLSDSTWTSRAMFRDVYLPYTSPLDLEVDALDIAILHNDFCREISKNEFANIFLMRTLKIGILSDAQIIRAIIECHRRAQQSNRSPTSTLGSKTCLDHASYLSQRRHLLGSSDVQNLRYYFHVVDHLGRVVSISPNVLKDREIQATSTTLLSQICKSASFHFLNEEYPPPVIEFLCIRLEIQSFPAFVERKNIGRWSKRGNLCEHWVNVPSAFFTDILAPKQQKNNIILYYLADIWNLIPNRSISSDFSTLVEGLQDLEYFCENGTLAKLSSCYIRTRHLDKILTSEMNILQVECQDAPKWAFLKELGVTVEPTLETYLDQIRRKKNDVPTDLEVSASIVDWLYKDLIMFCRGQLDDFWKLR